MRGEQWLRCEVLPGPFSTERIVLIDEVMHGKSVALIVDSRIVKADRSIAAGHPVPGRVKVFCTSAADDRADVLLPVPSDEFGSVIRVDSTGLETSAS